MTKEQFKMMLRHRTVFLEEQHEQGIEILRLNQF